MICIQEPIGAMLMPAIVGITAAAQSHLVTTMEKVTNGATLQTIMPAGKTVFDPDVGLYHPFGYYYN